MAADPRPALPHDRGGAETRDNSEARLRAVLALFDEHYEAVFRFARRSVDDSLAEDVTQEVFARLMRLEGIEHREINGSYLLKIASNLIKRRYQRERRFGEIARHAAGRHADSAVGDRSGTRGSERAEGREAAKALSTLSDRERDAVDLIVCRGLSYREAAESMGAKVSDVNNWRYRGVERLRRGSGAS